MIAYGSETRMLTGYIDGVFFGKRDSRRGAVLINILKTVYFFNLDTYVCFLSETRVLTEYIYIDCVFFGKRYSRRGANLINMLKTVYCIKYGNNIRVFLIRNTYAHIIYRWCDFW